MDKGKILDIPLLMGNPGHESIVNPDEYIKFILEWRDINVGKLPDRYVISFKYTGALEHLIQNYNVTEIKISNEYPIYLFEHNDVKIAFRYIGIGGPFAGMMLEDIIALGGRYIIFFGEVGVLLSNIDRWRVILPTRAIRDEGTSYHYMRPSFYSYPSKLLYNKLKKVVAENEDIYFKGTVWTTDAPYRETRFKRKLFLEKGAICVDMEAASLFSIAKFRRIKIACIFYAGDLVDEKWDLRISNNYRKGMKETINKLLRYSIDTLTRI